MPRMTKNEQRLKRYMTKLGLWKPEYLITVEICAGLMDQYDAINTAWIKSGMNPLEYTDNGSKKSGIVTTLESLRKDILAYQKELGLTPMAIKRLDQQEQMPKSSVLADALRKLDAG